MIPGEDLDPELVRELMSSTLPEQEKIALKQRMMAERMSDRASTANMGFRGVGRKGKLGGFMNALSQGMEGYMGSKGMRDADADLTRIGGERGQQRQKWFEAKYGAKPTTPTAPDQYEFSPGYPEMPGMDPFEEYPYP